MAVSRRSDKKLVQALLEEGQANINQVNLRGQTPLITAVLRGESEMVAILLGKLSTSALNNHPCGCASHPYHSFLSHLGTKTKEHPDCDIHHRDEKDHTALFHAIYHREVTIVQTLLSVRLSLCRSTQPPNPPTHLPTTAWRRPPRGGRALPRCT